MKLDSISKNDFESIGDRKTLKFGIDAENMGLIYKSFLNYSNPIGSLVREIASNCFDSHEEAGISKPVIIKIVDENYVSGTPATIHFIDHGVGLSKERVENIYCKFFTSTKRDTNNLIGGFGIGAKSPLGYVDMFYVKTVYNNVQYTYIVHKGEESPEMDLIAQETTKELNGTEVIVNIKSGDKQRFKREIQNQLKYFDNIQYINCGIQDYKLVREGPFIKSTSGDNNTLDICIGKIRYPLDANVINIPTNFYYVNLGLYFDIGEISVVWNRESIDYNANTIKLIQERLKEAEEYIVKKIETRLQKLNSLEDFVSFYIKNYGKNSNHTIDIAEEKLSLSNFYKKGIIYNHLGVEYKAQDLASIIQTLFVPFGNTNKGKIRPNKSLSGNILNNPAAYILKDRSVPAVTYYIDSIKRETPIYRYQPYLGFAGYNSYPKEVVEVVEKTIFSLYKVYDDIKINQEDIDDYKDSIRVLKKRKLDLKESVTANRYVGQSYNRLTSTIEKLFDNTRLYIIGEAKDTSNLSRLNTFLSKFYKYNSDKKLVVMHFSKENFQLIMNQELPNVVFYGDFLSSKIMNRLIQRMADYSVYVDIKYHSGFMYNFNDNYFVSLYDKWQKYFSIKAVPTSDYLIQNLPPPNKELIELKEFFNGVNRFINTKAPLFNSFYNLKNSHDVYIQTDYKDYMTRFKLNNYKNYGISKNTSDEE
jgi:hypothetical protein